MYEDAKRTLDTKRYSSISELVRTALRKLLYGEVTENGFTPEFEDEVLKSAAEPIDESRIWETPEDIDQYFSDLKKKLQIKRS